MNLLTLKINNTDVSAMLSSYNYETRREPVIGSKFTDLNGVDHYTILRYRDSLKVGFKALSPTQVVTLHNLLNSMPLTVQYHSFQSNATVTKTMMVNADALVDALKRTDGHWVKQFSVTFTEV